MTCSEEYHCSEFGCMNSASIIECKWKICLPLYTQYVAVSWMLSEQLRAKPIFLAPLQKSFIKWRVFSKMLPSKPFSNVLIHCKATSDDVSWLKRIIRTPSTFEARLYSFCRMCKGRFYLRWFNFQLTTNFSFYDHLSHLPFFTGTSDENAIRSSWPVCVFPSWSHLSSSCLELTSHLEARKKAARPWAFCCTSFSSSRLSGWEQWLPMSDYNLSWSSAQSEPSCSKLHSSYLLVSIPIFFLHFSSHSISLYPTGFSATILLVSPQYLLPIFFKHLSLWDLHAFFTKL